MFVPSQGFYADLEEHYIKINVIISRSSKVCELHKKSEKYGKIQMFSASTLNRYNDTVYLVGPTVICT